MLKLTHEDARLDAVCKSAEGCCPDLDRTILVLVRPHPPRRTVADETSPAHADKKAEQILIHQEFFVLDPDEQLGVLLHEIGHIQFVPPQPAAHLGFEEQLMEDLASVGPMTEEDLFVDVFACERGGETGIFSTRSKQHPNDFWTAYCELLRHRGEMDEHALLKQFRSLYRTHQNAIDAHVREMRRARIGA